MDTIKIGYGGTLGYYDNNGYDRDSLIRKVFWTFRNINIDYKARNAVELIKSMGRIKVEENIQIKLWLWGDIDQRYNELINHLNLKSNIRIEKSVSKDENLNRLKSCDLLLLPLERELNNQRSLFIPGKLFDYLSIGRPILCFGDNCEATEVLVQSGLGLVFSTPNDPGFLDFIKKVAFEKKYLDNFVPNKEYIEQYWFKNRIGLIASEFNEILDA